MNQVFPLVVAFMKDHKLVSTIALCGLCLFIFGIFSMSSPKDDSMHFSRAETNSIGSNPTKSPVKEILVDVSGAVIKPGVYSLKEGSRIRDALLAAGGMSERADRLKVSQTINLAAPLSDGGKLYIPAVGEQMTTSGEVSGNGSGTSVLGSSATVNINRATESELDALPGIGKVTAGKIIANRPYQSVQELVSKKVVGSSVFSKIKDKLTTY